MTSAAERIREQHRGWRQAEPASASRIAALNSFGLRYVQVDDFNVIVEGGYMLNLAMSFWRAIDGSAQGYLVSTLNDEIRGTRPEEKPAAGRDSGPADDETHIRQTSRPRPAEPAVGDYSHAALMERPAWP